MTEKVEVKTGYAVEIKLIRYTKDGEEPSWFFDERSHYCGSFSKKQAESVYEAFSERLTIIVLSRE